MDFLFTCDVELTSIPENRESASVADELFRTGLPRVLKVCSALEAPTTFYFTANLAELRPELLDMVRAQGHEIGCHGLNHQPGAGYDTLAFDEQLRSLKQARTILAGLGAGPIRSFRAPEARINGDTVRALEGLGFTSDSSVCPQRFDGPLSRGFRQKLKWLIAPRQPYFMSTDRVIAPGSSEVLEIPISAILVPFIGSAMRVSPALTRILRRALFGEARRHPEHPVVFLFHPNECIENALPANGPAVGGAVVSDRLRTSLKLRNLGLPAIELVTEVLVAAREAGFDFTTATRFRSHFGRGAA